MARKETEVMLHDIAACRQLGCDGVVIGALDAGGDIDLPLCRELVSAASGYGCPRSIAPSTRSAIRPGR